MRIPQTPERIKEAPAQALRAVFAGVGQILLITERVRRRTLGHEHTPAVSAGGPDGPAPAAAPAPGPALKAAAVEADLPLPSYSELTFASIRGRLRGLEAGQVRVLLDYERAHEGRVNVITMFERRIVKLEGAEDADTATH